MALRVVPTVEAHQEVFTRAFQAAHLEEDLLGSVLTNRGVGMEHLAKIDPECFTDIRRRLFFGAMVRLYKSGKTPGWGNVQSDLEAHDEWQQAGGEEFQNVLGQYCTGVVIPEYCEILKERLAAKNLHRDLLFLAGDLEAGHSVSKIAVAAVKVAQAAIPAGQVQEFSVSDLIEDIERLHSGKRKAFLRFGLPSLDRFGPSRSSLVVIGARSSVGKTSLCVCLANRLADQGEPVLYVYLESTPKDIMYRRLGLSSGVPSKEIQEQDGPGIDAMARVSKAQQKMHAQPLRVVGGAHTIEELGALIRADHLARNTTAVFVDHIGKVKLPGKNRHDIEIGGVTAGLVQLCTELEITVFAATQLNRQIEKRDNREPMISDIKNSGYIEEDADQVWLIHRPALDDERAGDDFNIIVPKYRDGKRGIACLKYNASICEVYEGV